MKKLLALALVLAFTVSAHATIFGPLFSGSSQVTPPTGTAPVVTSLACTIALPVTNGTNVTLVGGGTCAYTATCASAACAGINAITGWAITTQSTANSYSITNAGILQGGSAAGSVTTGSYTVTVTATNSTGTSPGVVQSITTFQPPVVASLSCSIKSPITNNTNVTLQAGGNCQYTATCGGGACSGGNAISGWSVVADTCTSCYQVTSSGVLQGSTNAATVTNQTDTVTVVATNAGGNSPGVGQTVTAVTVPAITNQNFNVAFPVANPLTIGTMSASPTPTSWAITAVSGGGTGAVSADFSINSSGVLTTTSSAPSDITAPGTAVVSLTATNASGTSPTGTATLTIGANCPQGTALADGCTGAQLHGITPYPNLMTAGQLQGVAIRTGSGYTNGGPYSWTSSGGGCSVNATGTVMVSGGNLGSGAGINYTITNHGSGCTSRPTIAIPSGASGGSNGAMVAEVYTATPHTAGTKWNVAGVDYPVGYDRTLTLANPLTAFPACPGGTNVCVNGHSISIKGNNATVNGYDFCNNSQATISISSSVTGYLISNNYFCGPPANGQNITVGSNSSGTVIYNDFNGLAPLGGNGSPNALACGANCGPNGAACCGAVASFTFEYNYCYNQDSKCWQLSGNSSGTPIVAKYNVYDTMGNCPTGGSNPCAHGEAEYFFNSSSDTTHFTGSFNLYWNPFHCTQQGGDSAGCPNGNAGNLTSISAPQADGSNINGTTFDHNVILMPGPGTVCTTSNTFAYTGAADVFDGQQEGGALSNVTFSTNYLDGSGVFFNWYHAGGTSLTYTGNVAALGGAACN